MGSDDVTAQGQLGAGSDASPPSGHSQHPPYTHTRLSGSWAAIGVGLGVLVVLVIFILENSKNVDIAFLGAHAHLAEGVALLLAAVIGGLIVLFAGAARLLQIRTRARRSVRSGPTR